MTEYVPVKVMTDEELSNLLESASLQVCSTWTELREKLILAHVITP